MPANELNIVGPTEFEKMCNEIAKRNATRNRHLLVLKKIMAVYQYMRCTLKMEHLSVSWEKIDCVSKNVDLEISTRVINESWPSYHYSRHSSLKSGRLDYFLSRIEKEYLSKIHLGGAKYSSCFFETLSTILRQSMLFSNVDLEENLWDPEKQRVDPKKLLGYIKKYTWTFPPNTQELLDEGLKEERKEEKDENQN